MAGKKISRQNMARIQQIADHAYAMGAKSPAPDTSPIGKAEQSLNDQLEVVARAVYGVAMSPMDGYCYIEETFDAYVIVTTCHNGGEETHYRADYSMDASGAVTLAARDAWVEVEEVWQPVAEGAAKAGAILPDESRTTPYASIKALTDRHLEVKVAYYGHKNGKDAHNEYFSAKTDFDPENFPQPPLLYYHGYDEQNRKAARPVVTGAFVSRRIGGDGHYLTYKLKNGKYADLQWDAAQKGQCVVSPGTVGHLIRKAPDGELLYWPLAEVSAWDYSEKRKPANLHSVAAPILKALYIEEGINAPSVLDTAADQASETPGDGVSTGDPDAVQSPNSDREVMAAIAAEVAAVLLPIRQKETH